MYTHKGSEEAMVTKRKASEEKTRGDERRRGNQKKLLEDREHRVHPEVTAQAVPVSSSAVFDKPHPFNL